MPKEENLRGDEVVALTQKYLSEEDVAFVHKALVYAVECHSGQYRKSGEPYIIHPIQVAGILAKLKLDAVTVACGFLHDVVEDTDASLDDLERVFGHDVRVIVDGVTKLGKVEYKSLEEQLAEISVLSWSSYLIASTICGLSNIFEKISRSGFPKKLWKSMLH